MYPAPVHIYTLSYVQIPPYSFAVYIYIYDIGTCIYLHIYIFYIRWYHSNTSYLLANYSCVPSLPDFFIYVALQYYINMHFQLNTVAITVLIAFLWCLHFLAHSKMIKMGALKFLIKTSGEMKSATFDLAERLNWVNSEAGWGWTSL